MEAVCERCAVSKLEDAFRHKTSGVLRGWRFPVCIACEDERNEDRQIDELRARGLTIKQSAERAERAESDKRARAAAKATAIAKWKAEQSTIMKREH